jgi:hypothetical protein
MVAVRLLAPALLAIAPLFVQEANAAGTSAAEAQALQRQLRAWIAGLAGPGAALPDELVRITPEGDRFRLEVPVAGPIGTRGVVVSGPPVSAFIRPQGNGAWQVEGMTAPSPLHVSNPAAPEGMPTSWTMTLDAQESHGVLDPTFAGASRLDSTVRGYNVASSGSKGDQITHIDRYTSHMLWQPVGDGRLELSGDGTGDNVSVIEIPKDGAAVHLAARTVRTTGRVTGFAPDRLGDVIRGIGEMVPVVRDMARFPDAARGVPAPLRDMARRTALAMADTLRGVDGTTAMDGVQIEAEGHKVGLRKLVIGSAAAVKDGGLSLKMTMVFDGLESPDIPPGPFRTYLPRHIALKPVVSGIAADGALKLLLNAIDADPDDEAAQARLHQQAVQLLAEGPLQLGLDDLALDIGPARLNAKGSLSVPSVAAASGEAEITADGLDGLMRDVGKTPELAQAMPFLVFLKGLGRQEGATTHWTIAYRDGHATVNGTDLSALVPGNDRKHARPGRPPAR